MKTLLGAWMSTIVLKSLRRRTFCTCFLFALILLLFKWGLMCSNIQPRLHINTICTSYESGQSVGSLCKELCYPDGIMSFSCHNRYMGKEAVFSGSWQNNDVIFKLPKTDVNEKLYVLDILNNKVYPSKNDFSHMIIATIKLKFNISINSIDARRMSYIQNSEDDKHREIEMENVWTLLQINEYLAMLLYEKYDVFPKLIGSCGIMYAVEKLNTVSGYWHLVTLYDRKEEWEKRIKIAIMILDFLFVLDNELPEPLHICDVKMSHFGITNDVKKVKYLDLDSVYPTSVLNRIVGDGSHCKKHSDCDFFDCRSYCNLVSSKCQYGVVNNNLQIVCEKIFLGWVMSGRVVMPGLLLGPHAPRVLVELLEICANPFSDSSTPRAPATNEIRKRLYNLLTHLV